MKMGTKTSRPFWQKKSLYEMTRQEWEAVCDGCGKCCLVQLEDEGQNQRFFTNVACDLLNPETCACSDYASRSERVKTCITMDEETVAQCTEFAPDTCSYRLLLQGEPLPHWHHLVCGDRDAVHRSGKSVQNKVIPNSDVDEEKLEDYVVNWV